MTPASWTLLSAPTLAGRTRSSLHSPPRTQAPRSRDRATWPTPASSWIRRSPSTSASTPHAASPGPRPRCGRWVSGGAATSRTAARKAAGRASPPASRPWSIWSPRDCPTPRSASGCTSHAERCKPISRTCSPSFTSHPAPSSPPRRFGTGGYESSRRTRGGRDGCPIGPVRLSRDPSGSAPISVSSLALDDRDISQLADGCQAGTAAR
jgi:hypothetical protein